MREKEVLHTIAQAVADKGGRALLVGGAVRDMLLGTEVKDLDVEVFGLDAQELLDVASSLGDADVHGASFAVVKVAVQSHGEKVHVDLSLPRVESKSGSGHRGFTVEGRPELSVEEAASRRDFTVNAMSWDPLTEELLDPFNGQADLEQGILRATSKKFGEDPLRVLRGMQFASRFDLHMDNDTVQVCKDLVFEFNTLSTDRVCEEWRKWAKGRVPSAGLKVLLETGWLAHFPELEALCDTPQDHIRHPEGWSISIKDSSSTINPGLTGATEAMIVNGRSFLLWKIFPFSLAEKTMIPRVGRTSDAEPLVPNTVDSFSSTLSTRTLDFFSATDSTIACDTKPSRLVWLFLPADTTNKTIRIVFRIPLRRMHAIMVRSANDFEVFRTIIRPVAIFVMDMLAGEKFSTDDFLHNISMKTKISFRTRNADILISTVIMDRKSLSVDDNILFHVDLTLIPNIHGAFSFVGDFARYDSINTLLCQVTIGNVWEHTLQVVDAAAQAGGGEAVMFAALLHDVGKSHTTTVEADGRLHSFGHAQKGKELAEIFMERLGMPKKLTEKVVNLVGAHMWHLNGVDVRTARRWSRKVDPATMGELVAVVEADCLGRGEKSALPWQVVELRDAVEGAGVEEKKEEPLLMGRHLLGLGMSEGPEVGVILREALEVQLNRGWTTVEEALEWAAERVK